MTNSPHVTFNVVNNNVEQNTPLDGVSHIICRTTKGKPFDPSLVISSLNQFQREFGKEIVPDGTVSNVEAALKLGSKLRVTRVLADDAITYPYRVASTLSGANVVPDTNSNQYFETPLIIKVNADAFLFFKLTSLGFGDPIDSVGNNFTLQVEAKVTGSKTDIYLKVFNTLVAANMTSPVKTYLMASYTPQQFDTQVLRNFIEGNQHAKVEFFTGKVDSDLGADDLTINSLPEAYTMLANEWLSGGVFNPKVGTFSTIVDGGKYIIYGGVGSPGTVPVLADWKKGYDVTKDFIDIYQLGVSNINQWLTEGDATSLHQYIAESVNELREFVYYIDVPLYNVTGEAKDFEDIISWVNTTRNSVGDSPYIAYFAGGYKYNNQQGFVTDGSNLGTVMGLGDASASNFGPWYHFSGQKRGVVTSSKGTVSPNYGSPSNYDKLNQLANARVNMSVSKATVALGNQVLLMHNFTSSTLTDSFRFLGVVRLVLYMKKQFRPILESALEEPNIPATWRGIHSQIMTIVSDIEARQGLTEPRYVGDQDVSSYSELVYNTEADVRQGKYKAKLTFKDVIAIQEITFDLEIDTTNKEVNIN